MLDVEITTLSAVLHTALCSCLRLRPRQHRVRYRAGRSRWHFQHAGRLRALFRLQ